MGVRRIIAYAAGSDLSASQDFYVNVLGMSVAMESPVIGLHSPDGAVGEVIIGAQEMQDPGPDIGVDLGDSAAVDAAHAEAVRRGLRIVYPLTDEPWGVHRFFVEDPSGTVVNVLAHILLTAPAASMLHPPHRLSVWKRIHLQTDDRRVSASI